jgi:hypothetical protein
MTEHEEPTVGDPDAGEVDESGENLTQQRLDEQEDTSASVDLPWEGEESPGGEVDERNSFAEG